MCLLNFEIVVGDRLPIPFPPVPLSQPAQLAIVAWNGNREVLILTTVMKLGIDVRDSKSAGLGTITLLELLPLKSIPKVSLSTPSVFYRIESIVRGRIYAPLVGREETRGITIIYEKTLGPHHITLVKATNPEELVNWIRKYAESHGMQISEELLIEKYFEILNDYMARGYSYFSVDVISVKSYTFMITPIKYFFESDVAYYPLKVSNLYVESTYVKLYIITHERLREEDLEALGFHVTFEEKVPVVKLSFERDILELFRGYEEVYLLVAEYKGKPNFKNDLELTPAFSFRWLLPYVVFIAPIALGLLASRTIIAGKRDEN